MEVEFQMKFEYSNDPPLIRSVLANNFGKTISLKHVKYFNPLLPVTFPPNYSTIKVKVPSAEMQIRIADPLPSLI